MADTTTPADTTTVQTIVVQVTPADPDPAKMASYENTFWLMFGILLTLWGYKQLQRLFDTPYDG